MFVLALTAVLSAMLVADLAQAECGVLESTTGDLTIQPGQVVTSCNGKFALMYQDNNVVLKHTASDSVIWSQPADQGSAYAFYRPGNPELGTVAVLPPISQYSGLSNNPPVASTPDDSDPNTQPAMPSASDNSDTQPATPAASDNSDWSSSAATSSDTTNTVASLAGVSSPDDTNANSITALPLETVSDSNTGSDTDSDPNAIAASGSSTPTSNLEANIASVAAGASSGQDASVTAASPTSFSKSDFPVALTSANNLFLDPPSNSYFGKRIEIRKRDDPVPDKNGIRHWHIQLKITPDGNLDLTGFGNDHKGGSDNNIKWSSDTKGVDCGSFFIPDKGRQAVIAKVNQHEQGTDMSTLLQNSPCSIEKVYVTQAGERMEELPAEREGGGTAGSGSGSGVQPRFVLPGRTIENSFKFYLTNNPTDPHRILVPIGEARLTKTYYYNGENVSSTVPGSNPDRAKLTGEATDLAQIVGYLFGYQNPGSDVEEFVNWHNSPMGASLSSRVSRMNFEMLPFLPFPSLFIIKWAWHHELWIKGFGDGHVECRGGHHCIGLKGP